MSGGRKVFVIDKQRVEGRGNLGFPLEKKKDYGLISLDVEKKEPFQRCLPVHSKIRFTPQLGTKWVVIGPFPTS